MATEKRESLGFQMGVQTRTGFRLRGSPGSKNELHGDSPAGPSEGSAELQIERQGQGPFHS